MSNIVKKQLKIDGMHCTSCALTIDFDLEDLEGVCTVHTHYAKEITEVEFDEDKTTIDNILTQIQKTGYKAVIQTSLDENNKAK